VATSVVNPFHRIGYREKRKGEAFLPSGESLAEGEFLDEIEELEGDESRD
jgi:hypothetical protein